MGDGKAAPARSDAGDTRARFLLLFDGLEVSLSPGTLTIGRDPTCEVSLEDLNASWRHAQVRTDGAGSTIDDLGSTNGTWVNGVRIHGARPLADGDRLTIGRCELRFVDMSAHRAPPRRPITEPAPPNPEGEGGASVHRAVDPSWRSGRPPPRASARARTLPERGSGPSPSAPPRGAGPPDERKAAPDAATGTGTGRVDIFQIFGSVADKAFAANEHIRAKEVLSAQFRGILESTQLSRSVSAEACEFMAKYAVRLAAIVGDSGWIDATVKVFMIARRPLPPSVVDELQAALRSLPPLDKVALREYVDVIRSSMDQTTLVDRMLLQRIAGLEHVTRAR